MKVRPGPLAPRCMWEGAYLTFVPFITVNNIIRTLLHPDPAHHLTVEQALTHACLTNLATLTKYNLFGPLENFDPRARWRNAVGPARALLRFAKSIGGINDKKDQMAALSSDDEHNNGSRTRSLRGAQR
jgi:hypothetical protein